MKRTQLIPLLLALFCSLPGFAQDKVVRVGSTEEFLRAIQPNTKINLKPGIYNLSELANQINTEYISWEEVFDGHELVITGVSNLSIIGKPGTELVSNPRYSWVMRFDNCSDIKLERLVMGHTEAGSCVGGVVSFSEGSDINIENSVLYGSGTEGLALTNLSNFRFSNSVIKECTYDLMTLRNVRGARFVNSAFLNTGEFNMIEIYQNGDASFNGCTFRDCLNSSFMPYFFHFNKSEATLKLQYCQFINNNIGQFTNEIRQIELIDNEFEGNTFEIPR